MDHSHNFTERVRCRSEGQLPPPLEKFEERRGLVEPEREEGGKEGGREREREGGSEIERGRGEEGGEREEERQTEACSSSSSSREEEEEEEEKQSVLTEEVERAVRPCAQVGPV